MEVFVIICLENYLQNRSILTFLSPQHTTRMSSDPATFGRHNDFVGGEASKGRISGTENATSGHQFVSIDPMGGEY